MRTHHLGSDLQGKKKSRLRSKVPRLAYRPPRQRRSIGGGLRVSIQCANTRILGWGPDFVFQGTYLTCGGHRCLVDPDAWQNASSPRRVGAERWIRLRLRSIPRIPLPASRRLRRRSTRPYASNPPRVVRRSSSRLAEALDATPSHGPHGPIMSGSVANQAGWADAGSVPAYPTTSGVNDVGISQVRDSDYSSKKPNPGLFRPVRLWYDNVPEWPPSWGVSKVALGVYQN
jgi:hypothetical protein